MSCMNTMFTSCPPFFYPIQFLLCPLPICSQIHGLFFNVHCHVCIQPTEFIWCCSYVRIFRTDTWGNLSGLVTGENRFSLSQQPVTTCSSSSNGGPLWNFPSTLEYLLMSYRSCVGNPIFEISWMWLPCYVQKTLSQNTCLLVLKIFVTLLLYSPEPKVLQIYQQLFNILIFFFGTKFYHFNTFPPTVWQSRFIALEILFVYILLLFSANVHSKSRPGSTDHWAFGHRRGEFRWPCRSRGMDRDISCRACLVALNSWGP